jgi:hypothetical protein
VTAGTSGLLLCLLALMMAWRDLRGVWRRMRWRRARATVLYQPTSAGPAWRFDFVLPDGTPVSVPTNNLLGVARRDGPGPVTILYDPRAPGREVEIPGGSALRLLFGLGLGALGLAQLLG